MALCDPCCLLAESQFMIRPHQQPPQGHSGAHSDSLSLKKRPRALSPAWFLTLFLPSLHSKNEPTLLGGKVPGAGGMASPDSHLLALNCRTFRSFLDPESALQLLTSCLVQAPVHTGGQGHLGFGDISHLAHKPFSLT